MFLFHIVVTQLNITLIRDPELGEGNNNYQAGSSVTLTCSVEGGHLPLTYTWESTCGGDCFINGQTSLSASLSQEILHSIDAGIHGCYVEDFVGHMANTTTEIEITGAL